MKNRFTAQVDAKKFSDRFSRYVRFSREYMLGNDGIGKGEVCGHLVNGRFSMWENIGIRSPRMLTYEVLYGSVSEDGRLVYSFEKRLDGNIFTIGSAAIALIGGVILSVVQQDWLFAIPFFALAVLALLPRFFPSKKNRQHLLSVLNAIMTDKEE